MRAKPTATQNHAIHSNERQPSPMILATLHRTAPQTLTRCNRTRPFGAEKKIFTNRLVNSERIISCLALLTHRNLDEAAKAASIGTRTLLRWMMEPEFDTASGRGATN